MKIQQGKKVENEGSNVAQLETRSNLDEVDKTEKMSNIADNHPADLSLKEIEELMNKLSTKRHRWGKLKKELGIK